MPEGHDIEQQIKIPPGEAMEGRRSSVLLCGQGACILH